MNSPHLLFVYGQLCCGRIGYLSLGLERHTVGRGRDRVRGRLYHLGDYPGLVLGDHGIVHGELLAFEDEALWRELDAYELFDPEKVIASEYRRVPVDLLDSGERAWVYEYNRQVEDRPIVASGNWWGD